MRPTSGEISLLRRPSAWLPIALSLAGLLLVVGHAAVYGIVHEADEGTAARVFWLLMGVQLPIAAYFALRWLPRRPGQGSWSWPRRLAPGSQPGCRSIFLPDVILAVDVGYRAGHAVAAGVLFRDWQDRDPAAELTVPCSTAAEYEAGAFWKRELPCILALLGQLAGPPACIVVDGHVWLDANGRPGLGKRLYDALGGRSAVVGVAKSRYKDTPVDAEVLRGGSQRPLYVTAVGMAEAEARDAIRRMYGRHRLPALLKRADQLSRMWGGGSEMSPG